MKKFLVVSFVEKNPPKKFMRGSWPLHVTIVQPFTTRLSVAELATIVDREARHYSVMALRAVSRELFGGRNRDIPVTVLEKTADVTALHEDLLKAFGSNITIGDKHPFRPHVTDVTDPKNGQVTVEDTIHLASLSLIEEEGEKRTIVQTFALHSEDSSR